MTRDQLDEFSRQLFYAIDKKDMARIRELKAAGARIDHPNPHYQESNRDDAGARITPAAYAAVNLQWIADDLEEFLGRENKDVPLAVVLENGQHLNLYQAVALKSRVIDFEMVLLRLKYCFDYQSPQVMAAMWDGAIAAAERMGADHLNTSEPEYGDCVVSILKQGVYGSSNEKYSELLSKPTWTAQNRDVVFRFVNETICGNKEILANWLAHGLSANLEIGGMSLLHHMAMNDRVDAIGCLLDAGADLDATCDYARLTERFSGKQRPNMAPPGQPLTAVAFAREAGAHEAVHALEAAIAKRRIDAVLSAAKTRNAP